MSIQEHSAELPAAAISSAAITEASLAQTFALDTTFEAANLNGHVTALDDSLYASMKRGLDVIVAVFALVLLAPVLAVIALLVWADSGEPIIFRQTRLGLNGQPFNILKFRTMTVMENGDDVRQATRNDARVTRSGHFLRAFSLDELPQLWNVLRGEMSIIGPRPHARAHDEMYAKLIDCYTLRQTMKPGITGWAQVNGLRGETPELSDMRARVDYDIWYTANANIALDIEILFRTAFEVFRRRNAF